MKVADIGAAIGGEADTAVRVGANVSPGPNYPRQRVFVSVDLCRVLKDVDGDEVTHLELALTAEEAEQLASHLIEAAVQAHDACPEHSAETAVH